MQSKYVDQSPINVKFFAMYQFNRFIISIFRRITQLEKLRVKFLRILVSDFEIKVVNTHVSAKNFKKKIQKKNNIHLIAIDIVFSTSDLCYCYEKLEIC